MPPPGSGRIDFTGSGNLIRIEIPGFDPNELPTIPTADVIPPDVGFHFQPATPIPTGTGDLNYHDPMNDWTPWRGDPVEDSPPWYQGPGWGDPNYNPTGTTPGQNNDNNPIIKNWFGHTDVETGDGKKRSKNVDFSGCAPNDKKMREAFDKALDELAAGVDKIKALEACSPDIGCLVDTIEDMQNDASKYVRAISCADTIPSDSGKGTEYGNSDTNENTINVNMGAASEDGSISQDKRPLDETIMHELLHLAGGHPRWGSDYGAGGKCSGDSVGWEHNDDLDTDVMVSHDGMGLPELDVRFLMNILYPQDKDSNKLNRAIVGKTPDWRPEPPSEKKDTLHYGRFFAYDMATGEVSCLTQDTDPNTGTPILKPVLWSWTQKKFNPISGRELGK